MSRATVTFTRYYCYDVEIDDAAYEDNPWETENAAIDEAFEMYRAEKSRPVADTGYDEVDVYIHPNY